MVYIGIDIAKFKHFASVVSSDGEVIVKPFPFENSRQGFMKLIEEIDSFIINERALIDTEHSYLFVALQKQNLGHPLTYRSILIL